jgi:hypothetical protein
MEKFQCGLWPRVKLNNPLIQRTEEAQEGNKRGSRSHNELATRDDLRLFTRSQGSGPTLLPGIQYRHHRLVNGKL